MREGLSRVGEGRERRGKVVLCSRYIRYMEYTTMFCFSEFFLAGSWRREGGGGEGIFDSVIKLDSAFSDDVGGGRFSKGNF